MSGSVTHFILYVADQARSRQLYAALLGIPPRLDVPGMTEFVLPGGAVLGLMPEAGIQRLLPALHVGPSEGARAELYLVVPDADGMVLRAQQAGAELLSAMAPRSWGAAVAYLRDPDGHVVAVARRASQPHRTS